MKILQVFTFYRAYLEPFYGLREGLADQPFETQMEALLDDAFARFHVFAPALRALGHDADFVVGNCPYSQVSWYSRYGKEPIAKERWIRDIVREQIDYYDPDVLYLLDPLEYDSTFLRSLARRPKLVVGWRAAEIPEGTDWSEFDLILSHLSNCREKALQIGARSAEHFHPAVPSSIAEKLHGVDKQFDVVFPGQWTSQHQYRNELLTEVARQSIEERFDAAFFLSHGSATLPPEVARLNRGAVWGMDMFRVLAAGRIVFNAEISLAGGEAGNLRLYEATAAGSFLLTQHHRNIGRYFEPGREIETFDSREELFEKIRYYLAHPREREEIARRGQQRVLSEFSMDVQAKNLVEIFRRHLDRGGKEAVEAANRAVDSTVALLKAGNSYEALRVISEASGALPRVRDMQYVKAICLLKQQRGEEARKALLDELEHYPDNQPARELLDDLQAESNG